jgi:hypothetical protein
MTNKKFWSGMLIMALVFGTAIIGCDTGGNNGSAGETVDITYTVEANGTLDEVTSSQLTFTFSSAVSDLIAENFTITEGTGKAAVNKSIRENLTGSGTSWTLSITGIITAGTIRVQIDKKGIERGRKTVFVHKNAATGDKIENAIKLSDSQWEDGSIELVETKWYKFEAEEGKDYRVQWKNVYYKPAGENYTAAARIYAYKSDGTTLISSDWRGDFNGYSLPGLISGVSGTVYLKVAIPNSWTQVGSFAIRFYDQANLPQVILKFRTVRAIATVAPSVVVKWDVQPLTYSDRTEVVAAKETVSGFRVYRSDTETGPYTNISGDFIFTDYRVKTYSQSDTDRVFYSDTNVIVGKTYWYKVTAYNSTAETDFSDPIQSEVVPDPTATPLTIGAAKIEGTFNADEPETAIAWYSFTAEAGKTYKVQWETNSDKSGGTFGYVAVSVFTVDKELVNFTTSYGAEYFEGAESGYKVPGTVSGVSGPVYIRVQLYYIRNPNGPGGYYAGLEGGPTYSIKVFQE